MNNKEELYYQFDKDEFRIRDVCGLFQKLISEYNERIIKNNVNEDDLRFLTFVVRKIVIYVKEQTNLNEISQVMVILLLVFEKKINSRTVWTDFANIAFRCGDLEVCREFVLFALEKSSIGDVRNSNREFIKLSKEDKEENVADIMGMIVEELERENILDEEKYKNLLKDFAKPLEQWRNLEVPKIQKKDSYDLVYQIVESCYIHKAYHTALRLSGLLFISDQTKGEKNLAKSLFLMGKITYELGHWEVAKRCFIFAEEDTKGRCWENEDKKYNALLEQETKLELTGEILEKDRQLQEKVDSGELKLYTKEEIRKYHAGELDVPFIDLKKQKKKRVKVGEKAIAKYEKYAQGSIEERRKGLEEAFAVLEEEPEVYEAAAYFYYLKANLSLAENDFETSFTYFQKAYQCENGKRNGLVLLGIAITLSQLGRSNEAIVYLFRTYILGGKEFIVEKVGQKPWMLMESYL